jgi:integrase
VSLTKLEAISYLLSVTKTERGTDMKGTIRTKDKCSKCNKPFAHIEKVGFICKKHETMPKRFFIDLFHDNKRIKIYSDRTGQVLDSYQRAFNLLSSINTELTEHSFDPSKYVKVELERFYFSNVLQMWLDEKQKDVDQGLRSFSYVKELKAYTERYFKPFFSNKDIRDIRRYHIDQFKASLPDHLSPKTIKNIFISLKNLFNAAYRKEIIARVPSFPVITVPEYSGWKWIDAETQIKILDALPSSDRPIFVFLFLHGCRPGEARALKVKDVDLASKTIRIRRTFSLNQLRETTKQKRQNIIPAHPELMPYIEDVLKSSLPEAFLFVNQRTGKPYNDETLRKIWHRALKKADLQNSGLRLYDASRHSFASQLINANVPLNIVSRLLGHSSLKMTQRYAHESADSMKLAMRNLTLSTVPKLSLKEKDAKK